MKKISFIILMSLMLFFGISAAAKSDCPIYEEYTGKALSDDYEDGFESIATQGAIIVDPGTVVSGDEFEMNDTLATATNINSYLSYDSNNKCKFVKYLSIASHSNGNADTDCFYFTNSYKNKYFSVSVDVPDFFNYYISLYSVQGSKFVLIRNTTSALNYVNLEIGSYVIKFCSRNNTQANYSITISLERVSNLYGQENTSENTSTTIYCGLDKKILCDGKDKFLKFSPSNSCMYKMTGNCTIETVYTYIDGNKQEYKVIDNSVYLEGNDIYFLKISTSNIGYSNVLINSLLPTFVDKTTLKLDFGSNYFKVYNQLFPKDDLGVLMSESLSSNIYSNGENQNVAYRIDNLYSDYTNDYYGLGYTNYKSVELNENEESNEYYFQTIRCVVISYNRNSNNKIISSDIDYLRFNYVEQISESIHKSMILITMSYKYQYDYEKNELSLVNNGSDLYIDNIKFNAFAETSSLKNFYSEDNVDMAAYKKEYGTATNDIGSILWRGAIDLASNAIPSEISFAISSFETITSLCNYFKVTKEKYDSLSVIGMEDIGHYKCKEIFINKELKNNDINNRIYNNYYYDSTADFTNDDVRKRLCANDYSYFKFEYGSLSKNIYSMLTFNLNLRISLATLDLANDFGYVSKIK